MNIFINDKPADITLEKENTLGDVMSGIEQWISPTGNRIKKICINGKDVPENTLADSFSLKVTDIEKLEVFISPWRELAAEALGLLYETCVLYEKASFDERSDISAGWEKSSASRFLASDISDIFNLSQKSFSGEGLSASNLNILVIERLREIADPEKEIYASETQVKIIAGRLEELPLDMQTGKDVRAAETIQLFSQISEKLFRILFIYRSEGLSIKNFSIDDLSASDFIEEFNTTLKELSSAYENLDTVLVGDIAEYELAPRLLKIYAILNNIVKSRPTLVTAP